MRMRAVLIAALVAGAGIAGGCGAAAGDGDGIKVVTTTNWHTDLVEAIGGDRVDVTGLMGPGVDPHLYAATAGDVETLADADMAVWNGINLEGKMEEVFEEIEEEDVPVITVGEAVSEEDLIPVAGIPGEEFDPHVWFDPDNWGAAARAVADGLADHEPEHADEYERNLSRFLAEIERTDRYVRREVRAIPPESRVLVTSHDAFSYFARAYGFEVAPIQGKSTATEATTADIERVAGVIADADLEAVFIESSVPQQTIDAVLASAADRGQQTEVGGELFGDSLGSPGTPEAGWAGAVRHNADAVVGGLAR